MELFIPSVLILLLAAAVIFFILPRFGAATLAIISVALLAFGIYQHMNAFGTEYRLSTWQLGLVSYAPYIMVGGLLVVIAFYLLSISPLGKANGSTASVIDMPEMPTITEMPNANTATNVVTAGVNNALKGVANAAAAVGIGNAAKAANNKKEDTGAVAAVANVAKNAASGITNAAKNAVQGVTNVVKNATGAITGNTGTKTNNKGPAANLGAALGFGNPPKGNQVGFKPNGLGFPISQV